MNGELYFLTFNHRIPIFRQSWLHGQVLLSPYGKSNSSSPSSTRIARSRICHFQRVVRERFRFAGYLAASSIAGLLDASPLAQLILIIRLPTICPPSNSPGLASSSPPCEGSHRSLSTENHKSSLRHINKRHVEARFLLTFCNGPAQTCLILSISNHLRDPLASPEA